MEGGAKVMVEVIMDQVTVAMVITCLKAGKVAEDPLFDLEDLIM